MFDQRYKRFGITILAIVGTLLISACGDGNDPANPDPAKTYSIGGTVSGIAAGTLIIRNNGEDSLSITENGKFTFDTEVEEGSEYKITINHLPSGQTCSITRGSGTVDFFDVTTIKIVCS